MVGEMISVDLSIGEAIKRLERRLAWYGLPLHRSLADVKATERSLEVSVRDYRSNARWFFLVNRRSGRLHSFWQGRV